MRVFGVDPLGIQAARIRPFGQRCYQGYLAGNECYAVLGIALLLALENWETTETTLSIATCQRLWHHDIARYVQEPHKDIDLFGMGSLSRLTGEKAEAKEFIDSRKSRKREIKKLALFFALNKDDALREKFKAALARFPDDLPFEFKEQKRNEGLTAHWKEQAEQWAGLGDRANYRQSQYDETRVAIEYKSPKPLTENTQKRLEESAVALKGFNIVGWAVQSFQANAVADGLTLEDAVVHAKGVDAKDAFNTFDESASSPQTVIASVAACVIRFGNPQSDDFEWAWKVMARVEAISERDRVFSGARIGWHPKTRLAIALHHDRRSASPRADSAARLLKLALHPLESVSNFAFDALFADKDEHLRWIAGQLAVKLCIFHRGEFTNAGWDLTPNRRARVDSLAAALAALEKNETGRMPTLPPVWVKSNIRRGRRMQVEEWQHPNVFFEAQAASKLFQKMPIEVWMASETYRPLFEPFLHALVSWTADSLMPPWQTDERRDKRQTDLLEWDRIFADLMARAVPFVSLDVAREKFVKPFLPDNEDALCVLANFADRLVLRHICDAVTIPESAIPLLMDCVSRVVQDRTFKPGAGARGKSTAMLCLS